MFRRQIKDLNIHTTISELLLEWPYPNYRPPPALLMSVKTFGILSGTLSGNTSIRLNADGKITYLGFEVERIDENDCVELGGPYLLEAMLLRNQ